MQCNAVHTPEPAEPAAKVQFKNVKDGRGHKVRGLWRRGSRFYSQMTLLKNGRRVVRRVPLSAKTVPEAVKERHALLACRDRGELEASPRAAAARAVTFTELASEYLGYLAAGTGRKARSTINSERSALDNLKTAFGPLNVRELSETHIQDFVSSRMTDGFSPGTVNRLRYVLNNAMRYARSRRYISKIPVWDVDWLEYTPRSRTLVSGQDIDKFCAAAVAAERPQSFVDFIRLLAFSGGRKSEVLALQWADVLWDTRQLRFRSELTKNGSTRHVNFNPNLEKLLTDMQGRRRPDSAFIFPSPWDSEVHGDRPRSDFYPDFAAVKRSMEVCPIPDLHTLRHFFISTAVMAGIDFMTIASWVGHSDGGVLIGSVYGHLNDTHKQNMATKLTFT